MKQVSINNAASFGKSKRDTSFTYKSLILHKKKDIFFIYSEYKKSIRACSVVDIFLFFGFTGFGQTCPPTENLKISSVRYADAVIAENSENNSIQALSQPLVLSPNNYYARIENDKDYLDADLTNVIPAGRIIILHYSMNDGSLTKLSIQETLTSTDYAGGTGFFDTQIFSSSLRLSSGVENTATCNLPSATPYLRFTHVPGAGNPRINGVYYTLYTYTSALKLKKKELCLPFEMGY